MSMLLENRSKNVIFLRFVLVALVAFLLRAAFLMLVGPRSDMFLTPDSSSYTMLAENLATQHVFSTSDAAPFELHLTRTPGYPIFLIPFIMGETPRILTIVWAQAILGALTAGFLFLTGHALWQKSSASLATGLGLAFDYVVILYSSFIMTEALFLFLFVLSLLCFARFLTSSHQSLGHLLLSGFLSGLATLARPVSLCYFVVPSLLVIYSGWTGKLRKPILFVVFFIMASAVFPFIWMARNRTIAGAWTISNIQGLTRAAILEERLSNTTYEKATAILEKRFRQENPNGFTSPAIAASKKSIWSTRYILKYPKDYFFVILEESIRLVAGNGMKVSAWLIFKDPRHDPFRIPIHAAGSNQDQVKELTENHPILGVCLFVYLSLLATTYVLALVGLWRIWKDAKSIAVWLALTMVYFFLVSVGFGTGARYRIPLMPAVFLLAGLGFERLFSLLVNPNRKIGVGKMIAESHSLER